MTGEPRGGVLHSTSGMGDCCPRLALWRQRSKDSWEPKTLPGSLLVPGISPVEICGRSETSLEILGLVHRAVKGFRAASIQCFWFHVCVADIMARAQLLAKVQGLLLVKEQGLSSLVSFCLQATFLKGSPPPTEGHPELEVVLWIAQHAPLCLPGPADQLTMQVAWGRETA